MVKPPYIGHSKAHTFGRPDFPDSFGKFA